MTPTARRITWGGLVLALVLVIIGVVKYSRLASLTLGKETPKALCYVSPKDPSFIKEAPGKDPEGNDLVPVYPTPATGQPPATGPAVAPAARPEAKNKLWRCPMHPEIVKDAPGKCPICGMDLVPVPAEKAPAPATPAPGAPAAPPKERKIKYWVSPMDPGYVRDKPGKAPCGMDMVPVYEDAGGEAETPGVIAVSPATVQSMGVRTAKVEVRPLSRLTLAVGLVNFNERNLSTITTKVNGWLERLYVNATGDPVRKGQALVSIYSPELVASQEEYLLAVRNLKAMQKSPVKEMADGARRLAEASRRRLAYFDISAAQIEALERTGEVKKNLTLASPANGIVTKRMVTQGMYVQAGMPLLEVADLSTVWVDADIYQYELPWIKVGQPVTMSLDYLPGETFPGKIDYIYPYLKEATRTAKVRLRFSNPGLKLKPEMFAQVRIESPVAHQAVVVPADAVIDTGIKQHVFIALGGGRFEPREVKLGVLGNDGVREVLSGLKGGEDVVTSAQFMLDSESRFREAVQMMLPGQEPAGKPGAMPEMKPGEKPPAVPAPPPMPPGHKH
jgi:Cu(I)/Ag(I) efflux system membrane fusion protein/cobalt-zinc-cadmium efflux system membrane fusion protein